MRKKNIHNLEEMLGFSDSQNKQKETENTQDTPKSDDNPFQIVL